MKIKKKLIDNITDQTCKFAKFLNNNNIAHIIVIDKGKGHFCQAANGGNLIPLMLASIIKNVCDVTNLTPADFLTCVKLFLTDNQATDQASYFVDDSLRLLSDLDPIVSALVDCVNDSTKPLDPADAKFVKSQVLSRISQAFDLQN